VRLATIPRARSHPRLLPIVVVSAVVVATIPFNSADLIEQRSKQFIAISPSKFLARHSDFTFFRVPVRLATVPRARSHPRLPPIVVVVSAVVVVVVVAVATIPFYI
jgi:hypothetical protein